MDNLFGKDDSGNDSDIADSGYKHNHSESGKFEDSIDIDEHDIKPEINTDLASLVSPTLNQSSSDANLKDRTKNSNSSSNQSSHKNKNNDSDDNSSSSSGIKKSRLDVNIHKHDDLFTNEIVLPHKTPLVIKERRESKEKNRREVEEEEREKMRVLVSNFTEDQLHRYEMYRRAAFPKAAIKRIMQTITGCSVSQNVVIAMSGIAKVYVGEIVEEALDVMEDWGDSGPLQPKHLREAVRKLRIKGKIPMGRAKKSFVRL